MQANHRRRAGGAAATQSAGGPRRPSTLKRYAASLVSFVAIAFLVFALVGLLRAQTVVGLLVAGVVLGGGGVLLSRFAWRLYRGTPGAWRLAEGRSREEVREVSRELARTQWLAAATFLAGLVPVYLVVALLFADGEAGLGAAAIAAVTSGALGLLSWWQGRRAG